MLDRILQTIESFLVWVMDSVIPSIERAFCLAWDRRKPVLATLCLFLAIFIGMGAYTRLTVHLNHSETVEQIIWNPARSRQSGVLGTGYPDVVHYPDGNPAALSGPRFTFAGFDANTSESMDINFHCNHQVADSGTAYVDMHYCMGTANTGNIRMQMDIWKLTPEEASSADDLTLLINSMGTADVTTSWTVNPKDGAYKYDYNFLDIDDMTQVHGGEMGQFDVGDLVGEYQNDWLIKISRLGADALDTHTGELLVSRFELHIPVKRELNSYGN